MANYCCAIRTNYFHIRDGAPCAAIEEGRQNEYADLSADP